MTPPNPDLSPDQIQDILATTADKLPDGRLGKNTQGHGVVNPEKALLKALQTKGEGKKEELIEDPLAILADMGLSLEDIIVDEGGEEAAKA